MPIDSSPLVQGQQAKSASVEVADRVSCRRITAGMNQRLAIGLLLLPAMEANKYLGVGIWYSHVFEGNGLGLKLFDDTEIRSLSL